MTFLPVLWQFTFIQRQSIQNEQRKCELFGTFFEQLRMNLIWTRRLISFRPRNNFRTSTSVKEMSDSDCFTEIPGRSGVLHKSGLPGKHTAAYEFTEFTEFTDASMPPDNAGMSTHRLSPYKAYYLY